MTEQRDVRQEAAQRLVAVGMLQKHQLWRGRMPGRRAPWQDPSQGQGRVLALLKLQPETTQKELTFLLGMSRQAMAELLAKLEKQGLVEREPSPDDKRVVVVRLTEAGREAEQAEEHAPAGDLLDVLEDDEVERLSGYLGRILERVESEFGDESGGRREAFEEMRRRGGFGPGGWGPGGFGPGGFGGYGGRPGRGGRRGRPGPHRHPGPFDGAGTEGRRDPEGRRGRRPADDGPDA
ncbi:MarR family winged helix-turn-helix transcriptional regulator [Myceligenerans salitolerans]|uniref:MarR family transcriptional regulator n=1 Tax=Myceligenerans salitolerans TaxID=1230528 RepID=A0ABS3IFE8_9MICO|nr:MarR family transcriptional regulator [Myceligenerans salitolerans]MBO0610757.1 MarR family transcriptional regulator [Myceligenerans salitolerans]